MCLWEVILNESFKEGSVGKQKLRCHLTFLSGVCDVKLTQNSSSE